MALKVNIKLYKKFRKYYKEVMLIILRQFEIFVEKEFKKGEEYGFNRYPEKYLS